MPHAACPAAQDETEYGTVTETETETETVTVTETDS